MEIGIEARMGQSVNLAAVKTVLGSVWRKPSLALPARVVNTVADAEWKQLQNELKLRFVVFDKDNTLTAPYQQHLHPVVVDSVKDCVESFGTTAVAIFSNSAGTPDDSGMRWKKELERETGIPVVVHEEKKPLGFQSVVEHFERQGLGPVKPSEILVVGDRLLTDTVFGNLHGAQTLHCRKPLELKGDNKFAVVFRMLENFCLSFWM